MVGTAKRGVVIALAMLLPPAAAGEAPIGPCSPYRAADGDIPSEMPGCGRRTRPAQGTLADELRFRRERSAGDEGDPEAEEAVHPRKRARHPR